MGVCFLWTYPLQQRYEYKQSMFSKMESSSQETAPQLLQQQCHRKDLATQLPEPETGRFLDKTGRRINNLPIIYPYIPVIDAGGPFLAYSLCKL
ncbi:hypothetical protein MUK42_15811 [Musa troglodytarum]|uniref:Uncharacterized protein n=1 Tax=Musa troglodytarum TaxID=320322 RepID=A0A9E7JMB5_9LILI|nr:hypothetical protein MUK42_15811 [Musa troglodytarum]